MSLAEDLDRLLGSLDADLGGGDLNTSLDRMSRKALAPVQPIAVPRSGARSVVPMPQPVEAEDDAVPLPKPRPSGAPRRAPRIDFGPDVEEIGPAPTVRAPKGQIDFGDSVELVGPLPTAAMPPVQDLDTAKAPVKPMPPVQPLDFNEQPIPPVQGLDLPPPAKPNSFMRGFVSGMVEQNPQMTAETLEGLSHLAPKDFQESLRKGSTDLHSFSKDKMPEGYKRSAGSMWDIKGIDDALTWAGETVGQGVASTVPSMITGIGGALMGSRIAGKPGAVVGGLGGAAVPSGVLNYGEVYKALKDEKIDPKEAAEYALVATGPMMMLDTLSLGPIVTRLGGIQIVKQEVARNIAKRIAAEVAKGAGREGITEIAQEMVKDATVSLAADKPFWTAEHAKGWAESGVAGAMTGGLMGGPGGIRQDQVRAPAAAPGAASTGPAAGTGPTGPSSPEDIAEFVRQAGATRPPPPPPGAEAPQADPLDPIREFMAAKGLNPDQVEAVIRGMDQRTIDATLADIAAKKASEQPQQAQEPPQPGPEPKPHAGSDKPRAATEADIEGDALLRAYGYTDAQIKAMSPRQRAAEMADAREAGVVPEPVPPAQSSGENQAGNNSKSPVSPAPEPPQAAAPARENLENPPLNPRPTLPAADFGAGDVEVGTRSAVVPLETAQDLPAATQRAAIPYTPAQGEANNRPLGHARWNGLDLSIETPAGGVRKGVDKKTGQPWETTMGAAYGYIKNTKGADGMHVDVFVGEQPENQTVYVINENDRSTGKYRQSKVMVGFPSQQAAVAAYTGTSSKSAADIGGVAAVDVAELKDWLANGNTRKAFPIAKEQAPRAPKPPRVNTEPTSLLQMIAFRGGLKPTPELRAMGITGKNRIMVPGVGWRSILRGKGGTMDQLAEWMVEDGFLPPESELRPGDTGLHNQIRDMMDQELRGKPALRMNDDVGSTKAATARIEDENAQRDAVLADNRAEIEALLKEYGLPANEQDVRRATEIMADEGVPADEALEQASMRALEEEMVDGHDENSDTYGFGATDEVLPDSAYEVRAETARGIEGAGGAERGATEAVVEPVSRAGPDGERQGEDAEGERADVEAPGRRAGSERDAAEADAAAADAENAADAETAEEVGADNKPQLVLPGAEKAPDAKLAQIKADAPLKPKKAQEQMDVGMFGDSAAQTDLLDIKPAALKTAPEGVSSTLEDSTDGHQGTVSRSDAEPGAADVQASEPSGRTGERSGAGVEGSGADVSRPDEGRAETPEPASETRGRGEGASRDPDVPERGHDVAAGRTERAARQEADRVRGENFLIEPGALDEGRSFRTKAQDNIRAIELARQIEAEDRPATRAEQADLAKYVGWGGIKGAFPDGDGNFAKGFEEIGAKLQSLLDKDEYTTARRSIQYAHYTAEPVVRAMWKMAEKLGYRGGGQVFEPGMGVGNFAGMMPADIAATTRYMGLELDHTTASIAKLLYPRWGVKRDDFTRSPLPRDTFDLIIGNPPFADVVIKSDPKYAKLNLFLHDYFFVKSLDAVRPGGVLMFISSAGTMNKIDASAREYLADRAELVGAIRLPGNAFKKNAGTEVTTDIVILRKRMPGEAAGDRTWTETVDVTLPGPDGQDTKGTMSRYFAEHPEMVLGEQGFFDKLYEGRYAVRAREGQNFKADLAAAVDRLPADVMTAWEEVSSAKEIDFQPTERKDGAFYLKDGKLLQVSGGAGHPVSQRGKGVEGGKTAADIERITALIPVKDALRDVYAADLAEDAAAGADARKRLNESYDAFVKRFGPINKAEISKRRPSSVQEEGARAEAREEARYAGQAFDEGTFDPTSMIANGATTMAVARARKEAREAAQREGKAWDEGTFDPAEMPDVIIDKRPNFEPFIDDPESYRLRAIEHYDDATGRAEKSKVFTENIIKREPEPQIKGVNDAVLHVLNQKGRLDLREVARLSGITESEAIDQLGERIYRVPGTDNTWQTSDEYLSGNVRKKLSLAKAAAARDPDLQRNVAALEAAQPVPLGPSQIHATLGMPWLPPATIEQFGKDALGLESLKVKYLPALAQWVVHGDTGSAAATTTWGTNERMAPALISDALNRQNPKIYDTVYVDGKRTQQFNAAKTQAAQDKLEAIKQRFTEWVWNEPERTDQLAGLYNEQYNNLVIRDYDGSYLTTPGVSTGWSWRPHQTRVIARIIQSGNTYMAHAVGAGKTSGMIGAGMEMRRLGLVRKPMYAVPNHMLAQFTKEFYEQYPTARIAVADERKFHTDRRKQFIANVALDDLDAVIITHSAFGMIPVSDQFQDSVIEAELDHYREMLNDIPKDNDNRVTRSRIEKQIERLEQRLSGKGNKRRDQVFTFEEMGVDFLFVDEAHLFRKLDFSTKMGQVKGISPEGSAMSWDLYVKSLYLDQQKPGRSLVLASGTPVTNTMAELFTISRYLQRNELAERGLNQFDAWAGAFGETAAELEQDAAGGYKQVVRFSKFVNVPELSAMVRMNMDVVTSKQLEQYVVRPKLKGGKRVMNLAEKSEALEAYQAGLAGRMKAIEARKGPPQKGDDIMLSVINDGRHAAIDMRLVGGAKSDTPSKLDLLVDNVVRIYNETKRQPLHAVKDGKYTAKPVDHGPATQMIFANLGLSGKRGFSVPNYIRSELMRHGIPKSEIAFIYDFKTHVAKQKLFNDMNEGKVRVLIGSTAKMATGVNAQRRLIAIHNQDPLWFPSDDEQRNGRGLRQGNMNPEIEIHDYSTKGTYDSTMWGMMARKARFIEGFFNGDASMRDMEDLGEASQYEQAKAITTNDPRLIKLTELKQELEKARRREAAFNQQLYATRSRRADALNNAKYFAGRIEEVKQDIAQRVDVSGDKFTAKVGKKTFTKRADFGKAVLEYLDKITIEGNVGKQMPVAEIGGFPVVADIHKRLAEEGYKADVFMRMNGNHEWAVKDSTSAVGITRSMEAILGHFEAALKQFEDKAEAARKFIAESKDAANAKFEGGEKIEELAAKVKALEAELAPKEPVKEPGPERNEVPEEETGDIKAAGERYSIREDSPLFRLSDNPAAAEKRADLERQLSAIVERTVGNRVVVRFEDTIPIGKAEGWGSYGAIETRQTDNGTEMFNLRATAPMAPTFFSAVGRAIENVKQAKAPADQWLNTIKNLPGVKQEELQWLGLDEWLKEQSGTVTKDALLDYVRANQIEVKEVEKGAQGGKPWSDLTEAERERVVDIYRDSNDDPDGEVPMPVAARWYENLRAEGDHVLGTPNSTKYSSYTLPGGENYRELLLTLPGKPQFDDTRPSQAAQDRHRAEWDRLTAEINRERDRTDGPRNNDRRFELEDQRDILHNRMVRETIAEMPAHMRDRTDYRSSHWDEPNILAHVRFNDRTIDGKKTLFIEEVQSDWHQAGKRKGYGSSETKYEVRNRLGQLDGIRSTRDEAEAHIDRVARRLSHMPREEVVGDWTIREIKTPVDAPFKTTWPELALKRMIRYAAENGYDQIAWTPGEVQAERYDLSKQISRVRTYGEGETMRISAWDHGNQSVIDLKHVTADTLADVVGKDVAEKILAQPSRASNNHMRELSGLDLKVGGIGMIGFYDKILPATVNKMVKKFGVKVGQTSLKTEPGNGFDMERQPNGEWHVFDARTPDEVVASFDKEHQAQEFIDENGPVIPGEGTTIHTLPITPAMREAVLREGFPLFRLSDNPAAAEKRASLEQDLSAIVERIVGNRAVVRFEDTIPIGKAEGWGSYGDRAQTAAGSYSPATALIRLALADPKYAGNERSTAYHEAFHAVEHLIWKESGPEYDILVRENERLKDWVYRSMAGITREQLDELAGFEIRALAFEGYVARRERGETVGGIHIAIRRGFEKLMQMLRRIRNYLERLGYRTSEDVFSDVYEGKTREQADRASTSMGGEQYSVRRARPRSGNIPTPGFQVPTESVREALADDTMPLGRRLSAAIDALMLTPSRALWDRLIDLSRFQRAAEMASGQETAQNLDTYLAASIYPGRVGERLKDIEKLLRPIIDAMKAHNIDRAELHDYLYARHAAERNTQIRTIDPNNDAGSGMTDQEAQDILNQAAPRQADFDAVAALVDNMVNFNRDLMDQESLESTETLLKWSTAYQYYVPLKGAENEESDQINPATGKGFTTRGPESRRALGRFGRADDILTNLLEQTQRTIIRGEKNRVAKTFLRWVQRNPTPLITHGLAETRREVNKTTGMVETVWVTTKADARNVFAAKVAGETHYMRIEHEGLLLALKSLDMDRLPPFIAAIARFTRQFSAFQTARNPEFVFSNLSRDLQDAGFNLNAETRRGFQRAFWKHILNGKALMSAVLGQLDKTNNRYGRLYEEWRLAGGKISSFGYKDLETIRRELEDQLDRSTESMTRKILAQPARMVNPFTGHIVKTFEAISDITESMTRLAVYAAARDVGMSQPLAAKAARSTTVDFQAKGKYGPYISALYAFASPAIQGSVNLIRRLRRSRKMRYAAGGVAMFGFALTLWNLAAGDDEDEDGKKINRYADLKYHEREKNIIIFWPGKKEPTKLSLGGKLPLGYALAPFFMMGENAAMAAHGKKKPLEAFTDWLGTAAKTFNPLGGEGSIFAWHWWIGSISPTFFDPVVELGRNRNWHNRPIHPDEMPWTRGKPHSEQSKVLTNPLAISAAETFNRWSGGNHFQKGWADLYPDDLEYAWNFGLGGYGKFMANMYGMTADKFAGVDTPVERIPFVRRFVVPGQSQSREAEKYYDDANQSTERARAVRDAYKAQQSGTYIEDAQKVLQELGPKVGAKIGPRGGLQTEAENTFKDANKKLSDLRQKERQYRADPRLERAERADLIKELREQQAAIMKQARRAYRNIESGVSP